MGTKSNHIAARMNHISYEFDAVYHEAALKFGLSDSVLIILYTICSVGDSCLLNDIIKLSGASKQTINSALRKMEQDGLIRLKAYNGRKKVVHLTDVGQALADRTVVRLIEQENAVFDSWPAQDQDKLLELMQRYLTDLQAKIQAL